VPFSFIVNVFRAAAVAVITVFPSVIVPDVLFNEPALYPVFTDVMEADHVVPANTVNDLVEPLIFTET
jgi:hypothetical protein